MDSAVMGFHVYQSIWMPVMNTELPYEHEYYNGHDRFAVAIKKDGVIVGHKCTHQCFGHFYRVVLSQVGLLELGGTVEAG